jgi:addiction module RelE/StbE family toxin
MSYKIKRTPDFKNQFKKLTKKDKKLDDRLSKKIRQIIQNPELGDPKSHNLKYTRGSHVDPFVIVYMIIGDTILFIYVDHHDFIYNVAPKVLGNIEYEFPELWAVTSPDLRRHLKR